MVDSSSAMEKLTDERKLEERKEDQFAWIDVETGSFIRYLTRAKLHLDLFPSVCSNRSANRILSTSPSRHGVTASGIFSFFKRKGFKALFSCSIKSTTRKSNPCSKSEREPVNERKHHIHTRYVHAYVRIYAHAKRNEKQF